MVKPLITLKQCCPVFFKNIDKHRKYYYLKKILSILINSCFPGGSGVKNPPASPRDVGLIPRWGRSSGEGNGNLLQYSCWENPMDRGA